MTSAHSISIPSIGSQRHNNAIELLIPLSKKHKSSLCKETTSNYLGHLVKNHADYTISNTKLSLWPQKRRRNRFAGATRKPLASESRPNLGIAQAYGTAHSTHWNSGAAKVSMTYNDTPLLLIYQLYIAACVVQFESVPIVTANFYAFSQPEYISSMPY